MDDIRDPSATDSADGGADLPALSPLGFWDRSTWDPDTLGAAAFGQPTPPYRSPGQVQADAIDAVLTGPGHPGWAEPTTRMAIDNIMADMPAGPQPDGLLTGGMRLLAAEGHPDLQAWAANDAAMRAGGHPLSALRAMNQGMTPTPAPSGAEADPGAQFQIADNGLATKPPSPSAAPSPSYKVAPDSNPVPAGFQPQAEAIAKDFLDRTGKQMLITSTYRNPQGQAAAMYPKFEANKVDDYKNKAALRDIQDAYDDGKAAGLSKSQIIDRMGQQIQNQVDQGVYISNHMVGAGQAIDAHTNDLSNGEKAALAAAIKAGGAKLHMEGKPQHFHIDMMDLRGPQ